MRHVCRLLFVLTIVLGFTTSGLAVITSCAGGIQKAVRVRINNVPTTTAATTFAALPNASITYALPAATTDMFTVTFSAEGRLIGNASPNNWIELQVRDNGVPMQPQDTASALAFASADTYASHSITFCKRIANTGSVAANHTFTVFWRVTNNTGAALTAWVDDSALHVEVSD